MPDLTIRDTERIKESNKRMSENIRELESEKESQITELRKKVSKTEEMLGEAARSVDGQSEKDSRIAELEKKVASLEELRDKTIAMEKVVGEPKGGEVMAGEANALTALLRQLEVAHKINIDEIRAEKDREINELKGMVADVLERMGVGDGPLSEYEAKTARLKEQDESDTRHVCD